MTKSKVCSNCTDKWSWLATYTDGSMLPECDGVSPHHAFVDIDLMRLATLSWEPCGDGLPIVCQQFGMSGIQPVLFRRRLVSVNFSGDGEIYPTATIHCLGTERNVGDAVIGNYAFIFEDGSVFLSDDRNAV